MTITKEELHKLIDEADIENLQKTYAEYSEKSSGMLIGNRLGAIVRYLKESQKPKELTLHEKLINDGFILQNAIINLKKEIDTKMIEPPHGNIYYKNDITIYIETYYISLGTRADKITLNDKANHDKVFEAIEFLTKWQS